MRARHERTSPQAKEIPGSRFELNATTVVLATGYAAQARRDRRVPAEGDGSRLAANHFTGRTPQAGVFAAGEAVAGPQLGDRRGDQRQARGAGRGRVATGTDLERLEERLAVFAGSALPRAAPATRRLGELGRPPGRARPGVAQDGHRRPSRGARPRCRGWARPTPLGHGRRGGEGLRPGCRPRRGHALSAVRVPQQRRLRAAEARAWSHDITANELVGFEGEPSYAAEEPAARAPFIRATWTAASPAPGSRQRRRDESDRRVPRPSGRTTASVPVGPRAASSASSSSRRVNGHDRPRP